MDRQERLKMLNELSAITVHVHICMYASLLFDIVLLSILPFTTNRAVCNETIFSVFNILLIRTVSSSSFGLVKDFYFLFLLLLFSCCCCCFCYCCYCCCCCFRQILTIAVNQGVQA